MIAHHEDDWQDTLPSSRSRELEAAVRTAARTRRSRVQVMRRPRRVPWGAVGLWSLVALLGLSGVVLGCWIDDYQDNEAPRAVGAGER